MEKFASSDAEHRAGFCLGVYFGVRGNCNPLKHGFLSVLTCHFDSQENRRIAAGPVLGLTRARFLQIATVRPRRLEVI